MPAVGDREMCFRIVGEAAEEEVVEGMEEERGVLRDSGVRGMLLQRRGEWRRRRRRERGKGRKGVR